ncbi:MAG: efflux RND transporter permease subunit [Gammaproteobacteria bacterium]|nr:efflux RND transporter permease subunit [Gammaproteobacteria bacterium]MDH4255787.1 efflux RND transporter permease subunit [Gammaproteobacteria bacterium]MDH5311640.1 efflux RND transporter permease subunit [Gammaproteobacteria bacterium]
MRHTEIALHRPVTTVVVYVALALVGLIASRLLPLEKFPDIEFPGIFIQIPYEGSTPEEIERLITRPVEEALATLTGVERMSSTTTDSMSQIFLQFGWDQSMGAKGIEARAKVDGVRHLLPDDVRRIFVFTGSLGDQPVLQLRISSDRDLSDSYEMLDRLLKRRIERIEGVSKVELHGVDPREIRILLDADKMSAHGISVDDLLVLEGTNFAVSAGRITDGGQRFSVRPKGEFTSIEDIENLVINEQNIRLRDIASIELRSPEREFGRHLDRNYAIGVAISKSTGANMVDVTDRVIEEVEKIGELPQMQGIKIFAMDNQGADVRDSLSDLLNAGLVGALLAIVVLYLFLRQVSTTLIVTASVPFSLLITLGALYFAGLSLNILSMMGLMLAVGMLVDNAVVVTESVFRHRAMDPDHPFEATARGVKEVGLAVIAGTATTIIVFVPLIFGARTDITIFLTHVAVTIIVALLASLLIAQTLVPMLAARVSAPPSSVGHGPLMTRLTSTYVRLLEWILVKPWKTFGCIVLICLIGVAPLALQLVKFDPFPQESGRRLYLNYFIEGQHPLAQVEAAVDRIEEYLFANREEFDISSVYSYYEKGSAATVMLLTDEEDAKVSTREVLERVKANLPELAIGKPSFDFDQQGGGEGFSLQISGDSTTRLNDLGMDVVRILSSVEGLENVRSDGKTGEREIQVSVDRVRAAAVGLTSRQIADAIAIAMRGRNLREFRGESGEIEVRLAFREGDKQTLEQLADLPLYTSDDRRITLGSIADLRVGSSPQAINRTDRQTAVVISANLEDGATLDSVRPKVEKLMDLVELPPGYSWKFGRGFERQDETQQMMAQNILLGIACIFLVMAALFESLLFPFSIILGSILFSVLGVFLFFAATGTTFSFMASIGIMILIGVVVNNGIVLIDHVNNLRNDGMPRNRAIVEAGRDRLRPILMTVATTILGLAPLAVGTTQVGGDGPPYFPMARAIIGGLGFSTVVSLLVVPALYAYFDTFAAWGRKVMRTARGQTGLGALREAG